MEIPTYQHDLGNGSVLNAYSIDPKLSSSDLQEMIESKDGIGNDPNAAKDISFIGHFNSLDDFDFEILGGRYELPSELQAYRDAIGKEWDAFGRYNGNVAIVDGEVRLPLKLIQGGFYDYAATRPDAVPFDLERELEITPKLLEKLEELLQGFDSENDVLGRFQKTLTPAEDFLEKCIEGYGLIRGKYNEGDTVEDIMKANGIGENQGARYLGHGYLMLTSNGKELTLVQRAKGMAVAPDCMGVAGSTPNPDFSEDNFDYISYLKNHIIEEMEEEFKLNPDEFSADEFYLFDDKTSMPFCAFVVNTPSSAEDLASRIHGDKGAIKEHPVLYSIDSNHSQEILNRFPVYYSLISMIQEFNKN